MKSLLIITTACLMTVSAHAAITPEDIDQSAAAVQPQVVEWRRWFHQNPELSNREFNTSAKIAEILRDMGLEPKTGIAHTGITALIEGGKPGPLVAIRTDIDGLPVEEQTGLPYASTARSEYNGQDVGVMHACGHDAHMAMVLGAAKILNDMKADLAGSVMLIFQPAEEGPPVGEDGGASMMLDEGIFAERMPAAVFGMHVGIMSSQIVMGLQTIASRQVDVTLAPSIISVGRITGGVRYNVIPDDVTMEGTIRTFDPDMREYIHTAVERTSRLIAESAGAEVEVEIYQGPPAVNNNAELTSLVMPALKRASGKPVLSIQPQTVAEDFSEYGAVTSAVFVFLGNWPEEMDPASQPTNHSPYFHMHEPYMERGVKAYGHMVVDFLNSQGAAEK
jgi:amidohydrolase